MALDDLINTAWKGLMSPIKRRKEKWEHEHPQQNPHHHRHNHHHHHHDDDEHDRDHVTNNEIWKSITTMNLGWGPSSYSGDIFVPPVLPHSVVMSVPHHHDHEKEEEHDDKHHDKQHH